MYQNKCLEEYRKMVDEYGFISIDGTLSEKEIHKKIVMNVKNILDIS